MPRSRNASPRFNGLAPEPRGDLPLDEVEPPDVLEGRRQVVVRQVEARIQSQRFHALLDSAFPIEVRVLRHRGKRLVCLGQRPFQFERPPRMPLGTVPPLVQVGLRREADVHLRARLTDSHCELLPRRSRCRSYLLDVQPFEGPARRPDFESGATVSPNWIEPVTLFSGGSSPVTHRILGATRSPPAEFDAQRDEARVIDAIDVRIVLKLLGPLATAESPP